MFATPIRRFSRGCLIQKFSRLCIRFHLNDALPLSSCSRTSTHIRSHKCKVLIVECNCVKCNTVFKWMPQPITMTHSVDTSILYCDRIACERKKNDMMMMTMFVLCLCTVHTAHCPEHTTVCIIINAMAFNDTSVIKPQARL